MRYIIKAISRATFQITYFNGYVEQREDGKISVTNDWTTDRRFATQFAYTQALNSLLDSLRRVMENIDVIIEEV